MPYYDTPIPNEQLYAYTQWLKEQGQNAQRPVGLDQQDYDIQGMFMDRGTFNRGHGLDTYKKPNHPTFSDESKYHGTPDIGAQSVLGKRVRPAYGSEKQFFMGNPGVGGYAAEDGQVVLNPYSQLSQPEQGAVAQNEAIRLWLRNMASPPEMTLTQGQQQYLGGYSPNNRDVQDTLIARILTGDPSAGDVTPDQRNAATGVMDYIIQNMAAPINKGGQWNENITGVSFTPGETNLQNQTPMQMYNYFEKHEPETRLNSPDNGLLSMLSYLLTKGY